MLLENPVLTVFLLDDSGTFEPIGELNRFTSLIWPDSFNGYSTFEMYAPITEENSLLLKEGYIVWKGGDNAAVIEIIEAVLNNDGEKTYLVKGRTLESLLTNRIIWGTYTATEKKPSTIMYELVDKNCVNPRRPERVIPFLECAEDELLGEAISFQKTGREVYEALQEVSSTSELGFNVLFKPREKRLVFKVYSGRDLSNLEVSPENPMPVILSTDLEDILSSSYYKNTQGEKNVAYVAGEGEGSSRRVKLAGNSRLVGFSRKELYVDARDLQAESYTEDGELVNLSEEEYEKALLFRGEDRLSDRTVTETFEIQVRASGGQYTYGVDYFKGDKVLARDLELGIEVAGRITAASENYGESRELILTFGYSFPTIIRRIQRQFST